VYWCYRKFVLKSFSSYNFSDNKAFRATSAVAATASTADDDLEDLLRDFSEIIGEDQQLADSKREPQLQQQQLGPPHLDPAVKMETQVRGWLHERFRVRYHVRFAANRRCDLLYLRFFGVAFGIATVYTYA
jgi:hypothetical protein